MKNDQMYLVGQKAFIRRGNEILVLGDPDEGLDYPGGKIQEGEDDLAEALKREVREETGLEIKVGRPFATWSNIFTYHPIHTGKKVFLVAYECEYVSGEVTLSNEHDKFSWITKDNFHTVDDGSNFFDILVKYFERK